MELVRVREPLTNGDVDFLLNSLGLQRGLQQLVLSEPSLDIIVNPAKSYRYLAFNTRRFPMSETSTMQAVACMVDKDFVANNLDALPRGEGLRGRPARWFPS